MRHHVQSQWRALSGAHPAQCHSRDGYTQVDARVPSAPGSRRVAFASHRPVGVVGSGTAAATGPRGPPARSITTATTSTTQTRVTGVEGWRLQRCCPPAPSCSQWSSRDTGLHLTRCHVRQSEKSQRADPLVPPLRERAARRWCGGTARRARFEASTALSGPPACSRGRG